MHRTSVTWTAICFCFQVKICKRFICKQVKLDAAWSNGKLDKTHPAFFGVQLQIAFSRGGEVCLLMACSEKPSVTGGLFSHSRALWCSELFLFEVHPSILLASSGTGCSASCEAADTACAEKPSVHALTCAAVSASLCASLTPQHLVYTSQLAMLNHSWWLAVCEFENKPLPVFSLGTTLEGYWLIPSSVNIDSFFRFFFFWLKSLTNFSSGSSHAAAMLPCRLRALLRQRDWWCTLPVCVALWSDMSCQCFVKTPAYLSLSDREWTGNSLRF